MCRYVFFGRREEENRKFLEMFEFFCRIIVGAVIELDKELHKCVVSTATVSVYLQISPLILSDLINFYSPWNDQNNYQSENLLSEELLSEQLFFYDFMGIEVINSLNIKKRNLETIPKKLTDFAGVCGPYTFAVVYVPYTFAKRNGFQKSGSLSVNHQKKSVFSKSVLFWNVRISIRKFVKTANH